MRPTFWRKTDKNPIAAPRKSFFIRTTMRFKDQIDDNAKAIYKSIQFNFVVIFTRLLSTRLLDFFSFHFPEGISARLGAQTIINYTGFALRNSALRCIFVTMKHIRISFSVNPRTNNQVMV
jgi:hypothetical protein